MNKRKKSGTKKDRTIPLLSLFLLAVLVGMSAVLAFGEKQKTVAFTPPPFEAAAETGTPEVPDNLGYSSPYQEGMGYRFSVCGNVMMDGSAATVYLTNPAENQVWLKLRLLDEDGNILGETGLIQPGEYIKSVELAKPLPEGTPIKLKIMGYEPETYCSAGSATLNTTIGGVSP